MSHNGGGLKDMVKKIRENAATAAVIASTTADTNAPRNNNNKEHMQQRQHRQQTMTTAANVNESASTITNDENDVYNFQVDYYSKKYIDEMFKKYYTKDEIEEIFCEKVGKCIEEHNKKKREDKEIEMMNKEEEKIKKQAHEERLKRLGEPLNLDPRFITSENGPLMEIINSRRKAGNEYITNEQVIKDMIKRIEVIKAKEQQNKRAFEALPGSDDKEKGKVSKLKDMILQSRDNGPAAGAPEGKEGLIDCEYVEIRKDKKIVGNILKVNNHYFSSVDAIQKENKQIEYNKYEKHKRNGKINLTKEVLICVDNTTKKIKGINNWYIKKIVRNK